MRFLISLLLGAVIAGPVPVIAAAQQDRSTIGLALSGGGARGGAHVGVLRALEERGVPIDYIAGTSMGAIVGALYASGYTPDQIEKTLVETNWVEAFSDSSNRRETTMRKKQLDAYFLIPHRVGFNRGKIQLPRGAIEGQHLNQIFQTLFLSTQDVGSFDELNIPFHAVATDLTTGAEVVLSKGSLSDSVRASMSLPGFFAPMEIDDRLLVDGGMANNLPISVVRDMGADIVIAVDISTPLLTEKELSSVLSVTEQITNFLTRGNTEQQLALLGPEDLLIVPELTDFSSADFTKSAEIIAQGYAAASQVGAELDLLAARLGGSGSAPPRIEQRGRDAYVVDYIEIDNESVLDDRIIESRLGVDIGQPVDFAELERNIEHIYSLDVFRLVTYQLETDEQGRHGLLIRALPRTWGPNYLQFGLQFSDDFSGSSEYTMGAAYTRNALNALGGELRVDFTIGREDLLSLDFYQPIDPKARWFVEGLVYGQRDIYNLYDNETDPDRALAQLELSYSGIQLGIGRNLSTTDMIRLDYERAAGDSDIVVGTVPLEDDDIDVGELDLRYLHDSLDSVFFPTAGTRLAFDYRMSRETLGARFDFEQALLEGSFAGSFGKNTLLFNYEFDYSFDDVIPVERWFELGGLGRLSGYAPDQFAGPFLGLASLFYYRQLNDIEVFPAYAGVTLEAGNTWQREDDVSFGDLRYGASAFIGADTPLGPVYLAIGVSDSGESSAYFYLGNPWLRRRR